MGLLESGYFDSEFYDDATNKKSRYDGYMTSIAANDEIDDDEDDGLPVTQKRTSYTAPKAVLKDILQQVSSFAVLPLMNWKGGFVLFVKLKSFKRSLNFIVFFLSFRVKRMTMIRLLIVAGLQLPKKKMNIDKNVGD